MNPWTVLGVMLVTVLCLTLAWPLNILVMAAAYKLRIGRQPIPVEPWPFWLASAYLTFTLALLSLLPLALGTWLPLLGIGAFAVYFFLYLPLAAYLTCWFYGLDEMLEGLSTFSLFLLLPGVPLFFVLWQTGTGVQILAFWEEYWFR